MSEETPTPTPPLIANYRQFSESDQKEAFISPFAIVMITVTVIAIVAGVYFTIYSERDYGFYCALLTLIGLGCTTLELAQLREEE